MLRVNDKKWFFEQYLSYHTESVQEFDIHNETQTIWHMNKGEERTGNWCKFQHILQTELDKTQTFSAMDSNFRHHPLVPAEKSILIKNFSFKAFWFILKMKTNHKTYLTVNLTSGVQATNGQNMEQTQANHGNRTNPLLHADSVASTHQGPG